MFKIKHPALTINVCVYVCVWKLSYYCYYHCTLCEFFYTGINWLIIIIIIIIIVLLCKFFIPALANGFLLDFHWSLQDFSQYSGWS